MPQFSPIYAIFVLPIAWVVLMFGFAQLGGWNGLASKYPASARPAKMFRCAHAWMGYAGLQYAGMIRVGFLESGVYVKPIVPVLFHPGFLVPWSAVTVRRNSHWFWGDKLELILDGEKDGLHLLLNGAAVADGERIHPLDGEAKTPEPTPGAVPPREGLLRRRGAGHDALSAPTHREDEN